MLHSPIERLRRRGIAERRISERHAVHIRAVMIDVTLQDEPITILNISTHGLLASAKGKFQIGSVVHIALPSLASREATIRWNGNGLVGCEFAEEMEEATFFAFLDDLPRDS